jgi:hypothetical protein
MGIPVGGPLDPEQHMVIVRPVHVWARQAMDAQDRLRAANGGQDPATLDACAETDHAAFASLIEALVALEPVTGRKVSADLIRKAGLVPVDQAMGY